MTTLQEVPAHDSSEPSVVALSTQRITRRYIKGSRPARVTRISIETADDGAEQILKPRLKQGVRISKPDSEEATNLVVASAHNAISIHHPGARAIISKLDGLHSASDISTEIFAPLEIVIKVISQLEIAQFLDVTHSKIKLHNRFQSPIAERAAHTEDQSNDASFKQLQSRMSPELSQCTWTEGVVDGGVNLLSQRQSFGVEIYGDNRLATLIYVALLASGVTNTKFSMASRRNSAAIGDSDLGTGVLRSNDFGLNFISRTEELSREWSLFPTASKNVKGSISSPIPERNIRVIVGEQPVELIQQLMRDKADHIFVGEVLGGSAFVGPFVQPGQSPCANCLALSQAERLGVGALIPVNAGGVEISVALSYQLAGTAVQAILQLIDTEKCDLQGAQMSCEFTSPVRTEPIRFARHPQCDCQWR